MLLCELNRIHSHLVFLGTSALELGAISMFWYCFREREMILDLSELVTGQRMHTRYFQVGGLAEDIPQGFFPECRKFVEWMPHALDDYRGILDRNEIWLERTQGIGVLSAQDAIALGQSGPNLRASGVDWDLRRDEPYLHYDQVDFKVPVYAEGDVYSRYRVRLEEMAESTNIVRQCLDKLERMEGMPWIADDRKVVLPPREELHTSMESLIHHFKIVTEGFRVPEGEIYVAVESPRGESGCYLVSDGGPKPWRIHFRAPSFVALEATATCLENALVADLIAVVGSLDAVMGDTRPMTHVLRRGAGAAGAVSRGDALGDPACAPARAGEARLAVARGARGDRRGARAHAGLLLFGRELLRHAPRSSRSGAHTIEVCTNVCCGLVNAQAVLEAFERELGVGPGETTGTARSRCAPSSASAAARRPRSSPSTTAIGSR